MEALIDQLDAQALVELRAHIDDALACRPTREKLREVADIARGLSHALDVYVAAGREVPKLQVVLEEMVRTKEAMTEIAAKSRDNLVGYSALLERLAAFRTSMRSLGFEDDAYQAIAMYHSVEGGVQVILRVPITERFILDL